MSRWVAPALMILTGLSGYLGGSIRNSAIETSPTEHSPAEARQRNADRHRNSENPLEEFDRLLSPKGTGSDICKTVSKLSKEDLSEALFRLQELRKKTSDQSPFSGRLDEIESALYFHWAEIDPQQALGDLLARPYPKDMRNASLRVDNLMRSVLSAWMRVDPKAAFNAVSDHAKFGYIGRDMLISTWTNETVFNQIGHYPVKQRDLFGHYCGSLAEDPARRNDMLDRFAKDPDMDNIDWGKFLLFRRWGYRDFNAAITEAENRQYPDMVKLILSDNIDFSPQHALPWAIKNGITPDGPSWEAGYSSWLESSPEKARQWFKEASNDWESEGKQELMVRFMSQDLAAQLKTNPENSSEITSKLKSLISDWSDKDAIAAETWIKTAPESIKEALIKAQ